MFNQFPFGRDVNLFVTDYSNELNCVIVLYYRGVLLERCGNLYRMDGAIGKFYALVDVLSDIDKKLDGGN